MTREELFNEWKKLGLEVSFLGSVIQNPTEHITIENIRDFEKSWDKARTRLITLWAETIVLINGERPDLERLRNEK